MRQNHHFVERKVDLDQPNLLVALEALDDRTCKLKEGELEITLAENQLKLVMPQEASQDYTVGAANPGDPSPQEEKSLLCQTPHLDGQSECQVVMPVGSRGNRCLATKSYQDAVARGKGGRPPEGRITSVQEWVDLFPPDPGIQPWPKVDLKRKNSANLWSMNHLLEGDWLPNIRPIQWIQTVEGQRQSMNFSANQI